MHNPELIRSDQEIANTTPSGMFEWDAAGIARFGAVGTKAVGAFLMLAEGINLVVDATRGMYVEEHLTRLSATTVITLGSVAALKQVTIRLDERAQRHEGEQ